MDSSVPKRYRLLDAFCGAGGCSMGFSRAGFDVVGIDIKEQPNYPFEFMRGDALEFIDKYGSNFDFIHTSPPCQNYSLLRFLHPTKVYPDLVEPTRELLIRSGVPWTIENVMEAPLRGRFVLCGAMFGLRTYRHRRFESSMELQAPIHPRHTTKTANRDRQTAWDEGKAITITGDPGRRVASLAMGIDWMTGLELAQAIPPAYTEFIGRQVLASFGGTRGQ